MVKYKFVVVFLLLCNSIMAQQIRTEINETDYSAADFERLKALYGKNKTLPKDHEKAFLIALSYFPELKDVPIVCRYRKSNVQLMMSIPLFDLLFKKRENRRYKIHISTKAKGILDSLILNQAPFNAQVGVLGHELAHVSFFNKMRGGKIVLFVCGFLSESYIDKFEYNTDQSVIDHGLGFQLLHWSEFTGDILTRHNYKEYYTWKQLDYEKLHPYLKERYMFPWTIRKKLRNDARYPIVEWGDEALKR